MLDYIRGAKAGAISGFIFGIATAIFLNYRYFNFSSFFMNIFSASIYLIIICTLFGLLFIRFYDKIPGENALSKSIILSIFPWVYIFLLFGLLTSIFASRSTLGIYQIMIYILIIFVIFGIIYALIFERLKPTAVSKEKYLEKCPNCGRVIKDDYKQCPYCEINLKKCPKCRKSIKEDYKQCPYCEFKL